MLYSGMLLGKEIEVIESQDISLRLLKGFVMDETKNTLEVATNSGRLVVLPKSIIKIGISIKRNESRIIEGSSLLGTPAERIKG